MFKIPANPLCQNLNAPDGSDSIRPATIQPSGKETNGIHNHRNIRNQEVKTRVKGDQHTATGKKKSLDSLQAAPVPGHNTIGLRPGKLDSLSAKALEQEKVRLLKQADGLLGIRSEKRVVGLSVKTLENSLVNGPNQVLNTLQSMELPKGLTVKITTKSQPDKPLSLIPPGDELKDQENLNQLMKAAIRILNKHDQTQFKTYDDNAIKIELESIRQSVAEIDNKIQGNGAEQFDMLKARKCEITIPERTSTVEANHLNRPLENIASARGDCTHSSPPIPEPGSPVDEAEPGIPVDGQANAAGDSDTDTSLEDIILDLEIKDEEGPIKPEPSTTIVPVTTQEDIISINPEEEGQDEEGPIKPEPSTTIVPVTTQEDIISINPEEEGDIAPDMVPIPPAPPPPAPPPPPITVASQPQPGTSSGQTVKRKTRPPKGALQNLQKEKAASLSDDIKRRYFQLKRRPKSSTVDHEQQTGGNVATGQNSVSDSETEPSKTFVNHLSEILASRNRKERTREDADNVDQNIAKAREKDKKAQDITDKPTKESNPQIWESAHAKITSKRQAIERDDNETDPTADDDDWEV